MDPNASSTMSQPTNSSFTPFTFSKRLALFLIVQTGMVSLIAVILLLGLILWNHKRRRGIRFLRKPVDHFFFGLLVSDMFRAIGHIMGVAWVAGAGIKPSASCTVEAIFRHVGAVGEALFTIAIAVYTFLVIYLRWNIPKSRWLPLLVNGAIVLFLILMVVISVSIHRDPFFYGPAKLWCWVVSDYLGEKIGLEYGIFWFVALVNILLYVPLFVMLYKEGRNEQLSNDAQQRRRSTSIARRMLVYPTAYIFLIVPMSVIRWIEFVNPHLEVAPSWRALAGVTFGSSGLVNSLLYVITRPGLLPSFRIGTKEANDSDTMAPASVSTAEDKVPHTPENRPNTGRQYGLDDDSSSTNSDIRGPHNV